MALKTFVKVGQVNNLSDARYCAGMGVSLLGFNVEPGTLHYTDPEKFREISEWVAGVEFVAEFTDATPDTIIRLLPEYEVKWIQMDKPEYLAQLKEAGFGLILRLHISNDTTADALAAVMEKYKVFADYFLLEPDEDNSLSEEDAEDFFALASQFPLLCGIGIEADTVNEILEKYPLKGISLKGGEEIRAGFKTFDSLADVLESLEIDDTY